MEIKRSEALTRRAYGWQWFWFSTMAKTTKSLHDSRLGVHKEYGWAKNFTPCASIDTDFVIFCLFSSAIKRFINKLPLNLAQFEFLIGYHATIIALHLYTVSDERKFYTDLYYSTVLKDENTLTVIVGLVLHEPFPTCGHVIWAKVTQIVSACDLTPMRLPVVVETQTLFGLVTYFS